MFIYRSHLLSADYIYVTIYIVEKSDIISLTVDSWRDTYLLNDLKLHINPDRKDQYF
jgi:hypothetical protein